MDYVWTVYHRCHGSLCVLPDGFSRSFEVVANGLSIRDESFCDRYCGEAVNGSWEEGNISDNPALYADSTALKG